VTAIGWIFLPVEVFACLAEVAIFTTLAVACIRALWRMLHYRRAFRRGRIPDDKRPLSAGHEAIWQRTRRNYRKRGHEPAFPELEVEDR
jgi:hypothetical protein